jgi:predicted phosphoadenosine phosphosulfate sulfurtransferase
MIAQYADVIEKCWWVALPLTTQNALSQYQPEWQCWEPGVTWVRQPPEEAITDPDYFAFYQKGMTFEAFVREFSDWFAQNRPAAVLVGIRADESYNRFLTIANARKQRFADDKPWTTTAPGGHAWYIYPIYDWKTADIWTWFAKTGNCYNPLYNLMFQAGVPPRYMRICEPFGPEQRQGLWLYHVVEPERWAAMCERVSGVRSGGVYAGQNNHFYGHRKILKPDHLCWREYAMLLLDSMPQKTAEHYRNKIAIYLHWYQKRGMADIPDTQENDIGTKDIPSWRRVCKVLLNNDYWCRALSFSPNKPKHYQRYSERMKSKRQEWGILCNND